MGETLLVCQGNLQYPEGYGEINVWMGKRHFINTEEVEKEWRNVLWCVQCCGAKVAFIMSDRAFPDMLFTRNAGLVIPATDGLQKKRVILSSFKYKERQGERKWYRQWFQKNEFEIIELPIGVTFEGGGEAVFWKEKLFFGYGFRASVDAANHLEYALEKAGAKANIVSLQLVDERFYHLDTAFMPIRGDGETTKDVLVYYPKAFDRQSQKIIANLPIERLEVTEEDACAFGCNLMALGNNIIMAKGTKELACILRNRGFGVHEMKMDEIKKGGGSVYCMTLNFS